MLALAMPTPGVADPIFGLWRTPPDNQGSYGEITIGPCDEAICGIITGGSAGAGAAPTADLDQRAVFWDMRAQGQGRYSGGKVWSPQMDLTVNGRLTLTGDALDVTGCLLGVCRSGGVWQRIR